MNNNISVCTAGKLLQEIKDSNIGFHQMSLIIFDECNHTIKGGHPFSKLMELYLVNHDNPERYGGIPQIIGMTASPGIGNLSLGMVEPIDHLLDLAARMDATGGLKIVTENQEELHKYTKSLEFQTRLICNPVEDSINDSFFLQVSAEMDRLEKMVSKNLMNNFKKWSQEYKTKIQLVISHLELTGDPTARDDISTLNLLHCYSNALSIYMDMRQEDAVKVMVEHTSLPTDDTKCSYLSRTRPEVWIEIVVTGSKEEPSKEKSGLRRHGGDFI